MPTSTKNWFAAVSLLLAICLVAFPVDAPAQDIDAELAAKAEDYDREVVARHVPSYGGLVQVVYESESYENVVFYKGQGDSTMWTATYGVTQAFRYAATGDETAKANAIGVIETLHNHMLVTQTTGYVGRYVGPLADQIFWLDVFQLDEFRYGEGIWIGTFWLSNSSSDQYVGFFHAMSVIYDFVDDENTRVLIRTMVMEVIEKLRGSMWFILDEQGLPTTAAPQINGGEKLAFALIAAHILDTPEYWGLYDDVFAQESGSLPFNSIAFFNRYVEYFAMNLKHQNFFNIFRLEPDPQRLQFYFDVYMERIRPHVAGMHQVYFDWVYLTGCRRLNQCDDSQRIMEDGVASLHKFTEWPNSEIHIEPGPPPGGVDPVSQTLMDIAALLPAWLIDLVGLDFEPQAAGGYDLDKRCRVEYLWQRSPHIMTCFGFWPNYINPGADYLMAYWMGRHEDFLNPHDLDPPTDDDVDDDLNDDADDDLNDDDVNDDADATDDDDISDDNAGDNSDDDSDSNESNGCGC
jgi:hypothetical protein